MRRVSAVAVAVLIVAASGCSSGQRSDGASVAEVPVEVVFGLRRDQAGLERAATAANDPTSSDRTFLSLAEVAHTYGATSQDVATLQTVLASDGLTAQLHPSGGFATARMPAAQAEDLLGVTIEAKTGADGDGYLAVEGPPRVPAGLEGVVTEIAGITRAIPADASSGTTSTAAAGAGTAASDAASCSRSRAALDRVESRYGIRALHDAGHLGQGASVAVLSVDEYDPRSVGMWSSCLGVDLPTVGSTRVNTDKGEYVADEIDIDLAMLIAGLPGAHRFDVFQFDRYAWVGEPFAAALGADNPPTLISTSLGYCERNLSAAEVTLTEWLLAAAAAGGITVVAASGDDGSSACVPGDTAPAVQYPAASPWVTAVGGSQWATDGDTVIDETVWSDPGRRHAGGGGASASLARPGWQAAPGGPDHRLVPDVAAVASPDDVPIVPVCGTTTGCSWRSLGGTSASGPLVAAGLVLADEARTAAGAPPVGFWNPVLYGADPAAILVTDITHGNNDLFDADCCDAAAGYDEASGLGVLDFARLGDAAR